MQPFGRNGYGPNIGGLCPFGESELGPHLTQCGHGRGLPAYQVSSWSIQPFGHNTPTSQTVQTSPQPPRHGISNTWAYNGGLGLCCQRSPGAQPLWSAVRLQKPFPWSWQLFSLGTTKRQANLHRSCRLLVN